MTPELPASWRIAPLEDVALVIAGQSPPGRTYNTERDGLPFFQGKAEFGEISPEPVKWCSEPKKVAESGDVLISVRAPVGPTNLADQRCCIGRGLAAIRPPSGVPSRFLLHYLRHSVEALVRQSTGSTFSAISGGQLRCHPVAVPPVDEQRRIVEAIESYLSRLDDAQASLERVQQNLKRYRASVLSAAVEGRLVPTEVELARRKGRDCEPASELLERILEERRRRWEEAELANLLAKGKPPKNDKWKVKYKGPIEPDTDALPRLPEGWCWASMSELVSHMTSGSRDWSKYYDRGSSVFLMAQNVRPGRLDLSYKKYVDPPLDDPSRERSQVLMDDLLVTIVGANTGDVCRVPAHLDNHFVCQSVALLRPVAPPTSEYLNLYLNSPNGRRVFEKFMYGQGRPHLGFHHLNSTPVPFPPLREQHRIVSAVQRGLSIQESAFKTARVEHQRMDVLRSAILKWAFEGKLVDQNPDDEPAEVLLERIRAEREKQSGKPKPRGRRKARKTE